MPSSPCQMFGGLSLSEPLVKRFAIIIRSHGAEVWKVVEQHNSSNQAKMRIHRYAYADRLVVIEHNERGAIFPIRWHR